jgi:RNA polymerase sigma-70 factor (ECF subfamily)
VTGGENAVTAVRQVYQGSYRRLVGQVFGVTGDLAEAEDVVHEAFARALSRPRTFLEVVDHEAWLRTVAINIARNRFRRRWVFDRISRTGKLWQPPDTVPGLTADHLHVLAALRALPPSVRAAIVLHHMADLPVQEVADSLGAPVNTVKSWLVRGRRTLARTLADERDERSATHPTPRKERINNA